MIRADRGAAGAPRLAWLLLLGLLLLAGALRFWSLWDWWLHPDEGIYFSTVITDLEKALATIAANVHPPLQYLLLRFLGLVSLDVAWLRLPAVLAGIALVPLAFLLAGGRGDWRAGLIAALLFAVAPGSLMLSQTMRPYTLHAACSLVALLAVARYLETPAAPRLALYAAAMGVALFLHYCTFVVLGGVACALGGLALLRRLDRRRALSLLLAQLPILAGAAYLYWTHIQQRLGSAYVRDHPRAEPLLDMFGSDPLHLLANLASAADYSLGRVAGVLVVAVLVPAGLVALARTGRWFLCLFSAGTILSAVAFSAAGHYPLGASRQSFYLTLCLIPPASHALAWLLRGRSRIGKILGAMTLLLLVAAALAEKTHGLDEDKRVELTIPIEEAQAMREFLLSEDSRRCLFVTDSSTYLLINALVVERDDGLAPLPLPQGGESAAADSTQLEEGKLLSGFQAGRNRFILANRWRMQASSYTTTTPRHLHQVLDSLEAYGFVLDGPRAEEIWLIQGGSPRTMLGVLPAANRKGAAVHGPLIGGTNFGAFRLCPAAYREYVRERQPAAPPPPGGE